MIPSPPNPMIPLKTPKWSLSNFKTSLKHNNCPVLTYKEILLIEQKAKLARLGLTR